MFVPRRISVLVVAGLLCGVTLVVSAQSDPIVKDGKVVPRSTVVEFEIMASSPAAATDSQYWSRALSKEGYSVRVRSPKYEERPGVTEKMTGRIRMVKVIGALDRRGHLVFGDRQFTKNQVNKLAEWLGELKAYGAQGSPEGKPVWGLSQKQFETLFEGLGGKIEADLSGKTLEECVKGLTAPKDYPYRFSEAAKERLKSIDESVTFPEWQRIGGMSHGSGLAIVLRHFGFGFWPSRTPKGSIELVIEPIEDGKKLWPLGWELEESPGVVSPKFYKITEVNLVQASLVDVAQAISETTGTPVVFDTWNIRKIGVDVEQAKVDHPPQRRNWSLILARCLSQHKLTHRLVSDEAGKGFTVVKPRASVLNRLERK